MTRRWIGALVLLAGLGALAAPAAADLGGFTIPSFDTEITVEEKAGMLVEERIVVEFLEHRHGIYRTIPIRYTDPWGYGYSLGFRLLEVTDDAGRRQGTKVRRDGRYVKIRIGDPDRTVIGRQVYVVRYRVERGLYDFGDHDEVYWNATGNEWRTRIDRATATVRLPAPFPADSLETNAYTGHPGEGGHDARISVIEPGVVRFESTRPFDAREGLTVFVAWPKGYVSFPGPVTKLFRFLADNLVLLVPVFFLVLLWRRYVQHGRDVAGPAAVVVRYEPPQGLSPGEIGTIVDENVNLGDITAAVVGLAVDGHLVIRTEEKSVFLGFGKRETTVFERRRDKPSDDLRPHQKLILDGIFSSGDEVEMDDLKQKFYKHIPGIRKALYERLVEKGYFAGSPPATRQKYVLMGIGAGVLTGVVGFVWAQLRGGVMPQALVVPLAAAVLTMVLFFAFAPAMPRRTRKGVTARSWALGFEEFMDRVERDRLEADQARNVFETLLPYAMALGLAAAWARKFEGIYDQAGPAWYVGSHPGAFSTRGFEQNLSSAMSDVGQAMASSPRSQGSSGGGGGGFSGGGGGGGGGGSW